MQKIVLNNNEYNISFNFGVIREVCKQGSMTVPQMIEKLANGDLETIALVLYHGIKCNHDDFTMDIINQLSLGEVFASFDTVGKLMNDNMPTGDGKKKRTTKKK